MLLGVHMAQWYFARFYFMVGEFRVFLEELAGRADRIPTVFSFSSSKLQGGKSLLGCHGWEGSGAAVARQDTELGRSWGQFLTEELAELTCPPAQAGTGTATPCPSLCLGILLRQHLQQHPNLLNLAEARKVSVVWEVLGKNIKVNIDTSIMIASHHCNYSSTSILMFSRTVISNDLFLSPHTNQSHH